MVVVYWGEVRWGKNEEGTAEAKVKIEFKNTIYAKKKVEALYECLLLKI